MECVVALVLGWTGALFFCPPPPQDTPPQLRERERQGAPAPELPASSSSGVSFYPMPALGSDKNSGLTYGLLGALMFTNEEGIQDRLVTATIAHQDLAGWSGDASYRVYPTRTAVMEVDGYLAQEVESSLRAFYEDSRYVEGLYHMRMEFLDQRRGTDRYFGRADDAPQSAESVRTSNEYNAEARFGPRLNEVWDIEGTLRWRHFRVGDSLITDLPQMTELYPNEPGIEGGQVFATGVRIVAESRDS